LQQAVKILQLSLPELERIVQSESHTPMLEQRDEFVAADERPIVWVGNSKEDLKAFPKEVCTQIGYALEIAQDGGQHPDAKPLEAFAGVGLLEVIEDFDGVAFSAVYTVRFQEAVYVLHSFRKKSRSGIVTPPADVTLIRERLKRAEELHVRRIIKGGSGER
jgi:phage-related protein